MTTNNNFKTFLLLGGLTALILLIGGVLGGRGGIMIALVLALVTNIGAYWFSDKIVLSMYHAQDIAYEEMPELYHVVDDLAAKAGIPTPRLCLIPEDAPNAFATGRDPEHAVVAVTDGLLHLLSLKEIKGVLAHEIAHIAHRDILIQSISGMMASAITSLAYMLQFGSLFGKRDNIFASIVLALLAPLAASLLQMAISRSREYLADESGAYYCGNPLLLASALEKLAIHSGRIPLQSGNPATAGMFIVSPLFGGEKIEKLFSTHPPIEERIQILREMAVAR